MTICRKLPGTFYFGPLSCLLSFLQRYVFCLNYRAKKYVRTRCNAAKTPQWVSESIQIVWLLVGVAVLSCVNNGITERDLLIDKILGFPGVVNDGIVKGFLVALVTYRLLEIVVFVLNWILVSEGNEKLHSYRRALVGFFLNLIELAIYTTIIARFFSCWYMPASGLEAVIASLSNLVSIGGGGGLPKGCLCFGFSLVKAFGAWTIVAVTIASLVGGILREEVKDQS